jgi:hypothetical protein
MPRIPTTRKRRCAWTLTLTAALLAVVWVGSMKLVVVVDVPPRYTVHCESGRLIIFRYINPGRPDKWLWYIGTSRRWAVEWRFYSRYLSNLDDFPWATYTAIPLWPFVLLTGVPGVWMLNKTRKRTNPHACPACGYDRTGLPQSSSGPAPCPECGKGKHESR